MKKVKISFLFGMILLAVTMMMFIAGPAIAQTFTSAALVKIEPDNEGGKLAGFLIDPATRYVKKNTIVVWLSGVPEIEVQIVFEEGKTCRDVTANPNMKIPGFFLDSRNCYVTSFLPYAGTTTLQFVEVGTYEYEVVIADGKMKTKGKIVVSD